MWKVRQILNAWFHFELKKKKSYEVKTFWQESFKTDMILLISSNEKAAVTTKRILGGGSFFSSASK